MSCGPPSTARSVGHSPADTGHGRFLCTFSTRDVERGPHGRPSDQCEASKSASAAIGRGQQRPQPLCGGLDAGGAYVHADQAGRRRVCLVAERHDDGVRRVSVVLPLDSAGLLQTPSMLRRVVCLPLCGWTALSDCAVGHDRRHSGHVPVLSGTSACENEHGLSTVRTYLLTMLGRRRSSPDAFGKYSRGLVPLPAQHIAHTVGRLVMSTCRLWSSWVTMHRCRSKGSQPRTICQDVCG